MTTGLPQLALWLALAASGPQAAEVPAVTLARTWAVELPAVPRSEPFALNACRETEGLVAIPYSGLLEARSVRDGSVAWQLAAGGDELLAGPFGLVCGPARLAVWRKDAAGTGGRLVLLDAASGRSLAEEAADGRAVGPPVGTPGRGGWILPLEDGRVVLFDAAGRLEGHVELRAPVGGAVLRVAGRPLIGKADGSGLLRADGGPLAARRLRGVDLARAAAEDGWFLAARDERLVTAVRCRARRRDRLRCRRVWTQRLAGSVAAPPVLDERAAYVPSRDTHAYAFRRDNGHTLWRTGLEHRLGRLVRLTPDWLLAAGEKTASLFLLAAADGARAGSVDAGAGNPAAVIVAGPIATPGRALVAVLTPPERQPELVGFRIEPRPEETGKPPVTTGAATTSSPDERSPR